MSALASSSKLTLSPSYAVLKPRLAQLSRLPSSRSSSTEAARPRTVFVKPRPNPRPVDAAGTKGGKSDTLWHSWLNLRPSTRLLYGVTVAVLAVAGLKISDTLQARMPAPGEEVGEGSKKRRPKLLGFSVVDRKGP